MVDLVGQVALEREIENGRGLTQIGRDFSKFRARFARKSIMEPPWHKSCIRHCKAITRDSFAKIKILSEGLYYLNFKILGFYINFIQYETTVHVVLA